MRYMIAALMAIAITGCRDTSGGNEQNKISGNVSVYHDNNRYVTCWIYESSFVSGRGLSCIPDNQLPSPDDCVPGTESYGDDEFPGACVSFKSKYTEYR